MAEAKDDLEATRTVIDTLLPFEPSDQQRIIRWACEKLGISFPAPAVVHGGIHDVGKSYEVPPPRQALPGGPLDIKSFVNSKNPSSDTQFAATVAYYYAFEAPEAQRRSSITAEDLQDACRQVGRSRLQDPGQTLRNASSGGLLDKAERGAYKINTVGENLVAVTLPSGTVSTKRKGKKKSNVSKKATKKKARVKAGKKAGRTSSKSK